jgi:hypothetical protein
MEAKDDASLGAMFRGSLEERLMMYVSRASVRFGYRSGGSDQVLKVLNAS